MPDRPGANLPLIGITMGDAAGIGPELVVKVFRDERTRRWCRPLVVGDAGTLRRAAEQMGFKTSVATVSNIETARFTPGEMDVVEPSSEVLPDLTGVKLGQLSVAAGKASGVCLAKAFELVLAGTIDGVVSAPMNKEAFHRAGYAYRDEVEFIRELTGCDDAAIMGLMEGLWTVTVAEHVAFRAIPDLIKRPRIAERISLMHETLKRLGVERPRIAVAALNVHGGEGGLFGGEEMDEIAPAVEEVRDTGLNVTGPVPADTVFVRATGGEFDGVVCMYHDQANIARKLVARRRGATVFMGFPVPCGTTAHGTAFDIAGKGVADTGSIMEALECTAKLAASMQPS